MWLTAEARLLQSLTASLHHGPERLPGSLCIAWQAVSSAHVRCSLLLTGFTFKVVKHTLLCCAFDGTPWPSSTSPVLPSAAGWVHAQGCGAHCCAPDGHAGCSAPGCPAPVWTRCLLHGLCRHRGTAPRFGCDTACGCVRGDSRLATLSACPGCPAPMRTEFCRPFLPPNLSAAQCAQTRMRC